MRAFRAIGVASIVGACVVAAAGCRTSSERERVDFERMRVQQRYDLYGKSRAFANGAAMQAPPAGTLTRESGRTGFAAAAGESGGQSLATIPIPVTPAVLARGKGRFTIYCAVCHGPAGFGGSLIAEDMGQPRPPSLRAGAAATLTPGALFRVITFGFGRMPAYAPQLTVEDRWSVIAYLEQLRRTAPTSTEAIADSLRALEIHRIDSVAASQGRR
jgi:mono/diheme cytochrome c family protein